MDKRVQVMIEVIGRDLQQELPIAEVASQVNLSASRLRHLFKEEVGLAPEQYQKFARLEVARRLLYNSFLRVKEIMSVVGISDKSHFVRDFKKAYGRTPVQYRAARKPTGDKAPPMANSIGE
jgi:AraC-like DNA-binding protein